MTAPRSLLRTVLWSLTALAALVSLVLLVATLALPGWLADRGVALASQALGRPVSIEAAHVQPWRLALVADGLRIGGPQPGQPPLLTLARVDVALSLRSLLRGRLVVESLSLTRPELRLARVAEGKYDIDDLIQRFSTQPAGKAPTTDDEPEFAIYNIELSEGRLLFDDRPVQRRHELKALHLALPYLSTLATDVTVKVQPRLSGRLDGVAFDSRAEALPFADEARARLSFKLAGLDLQPLAAYLPASAPVRLATGTLDVDLAVDFAERPKQAPGLTVSGLLQLHNLALTLPDGQPLVGWKRLTLPLADLQPLRRQLALGSVVLDEPSVWLRPWPRSEPSEAAPPWQLSWAGLAVNDGRVTARGKTAEAMQLKFGAGAWPLKSASRLDASLRLEGAAISGQASLSPELLTADAQVTDLALEHLAAWLPLPGGAQLAAGLSGQLALRVTDPLAAEPADRAELTASELDLKQLRLTVPGVARPVLSWTGAQLDRATVSPGKHRIALGQLAVESPCASLARDAQGQLNIAPLLPAPQAEAAPAGLSWTLALAGLVIDRGGLRWRDAAVPAGVAPVALAIEPMRLQLGPLAWPGAAPVPAQLAVQLAALGDNDLPLPTTRGSLQWRGRVGLAPLSAQGALQAQTLPLQLLNAYLDPAWGLQLQRAELGVQAEVTATRQAQGWQGGLSGDVRVGPLALLQARVLEGERVVGEDLLSWQLLQLDGVKFTLEPGAAPQLGVRDALLEDGYARLIINEQGRFNLRDIGPAEAARAASSPTATPAPQALAYAIERIRLNRGLVDFSDRFVRPNTSARLSELQGSLGAFSSTSTAMAPLTLRGKVAGTGQLAIDGQLRPGTPLALDVQAQATDIELAPLSAYAGKYVGYAIERGKLSSRLRYRVEPGGQLEASNQITLDQLTFGERVDSPSATTLPVRFAVALLKDGNGVIDVNLPISGSLNDPEFSVGGLVWRLVLNLIGKALTSPFALFSGSDAPEEAQVVFPSGTADLPADDKLDRVARLLADKPGVRLTLTGWAAPVADSQALREQRLERALQAQGAVTPEAALKRLYEATALSNKPLNLLGRPKELPAPQMRGLLMGAYSVDDETLRQLAAARAIAVRDALLARGAPNARVFLASPKVCDSACDEQWRPHVELSLGAH